MKKRITQSQAIRRGILHQLYQVRLDAPATPWVWRRDMEQKTGGPIDFEVSYLTELGHIAEDGPKYRITALGINHVESDPAL